MLVLLDIDHTLINTNQLRLSITQALVQKLNLSVEQFVEAEKQYVSSLENRHDFNPQDYLSFLGQQLEVPTSQLSEVFFNTSFYRSALFPEVVPALKDLVVNFTLGIYSEGFTDFQLAKLQHAGISGFFHKTHYYIFRRKLKPENISQLPQKSIIVDDNPTVIEVLRQAKTIRTIWINRQDMSQHQSVQTIHALDQLGKLLKPTK